MELYKEILAKILEKEELQITFTNFKISTTEIMKIVWHNSPPKKHPLELAAKGCFLVYNLTLTKILKKSMCYILISL